MNKSCFVSKLKRNLLNKAKFIALFFTHCSLATYLKNRGKGNIFAKIAYQNHFIKEILGSYDATKLISGFSHIMNPNAECI